MSNTNIAESLKKLRLSFWFSQEHIANYLKINRAAVALMESWKRNIKLDELKNLSKLYDMTIDSFENGIELHNIKNDTFNKIKFRNVLLYILWKCGANPNVGKTIIYKLLYFTDFKFLEQFWRYITWIKYVKFPRWPVPYDFDIYVNEMKEEWLLTQVITEFWWYPQYKLIPNKWYDEKSLTKEETEFMDKIISQYSNKTATEISELSHQELPWLMTKDMCEIKFDLVKMN